MDKDGSVTSIAASFMLKWVTGDFKHTVLKPRTASFSHIDAGFGTLCVFPLQAVHVMVMLGFKASVKKLILIASLCVNKMAFLERGCGELRSRCLIIIHSKYGQGCSGE